MKYFITGGSSFIGNNVIRSILSHGDNEVEVLMKKRDSDALQGLKVKKVFGSISTPESYAEHITEDTIVIHMSHLHDYNPKNKEEIFLMNYEASRCLIDYCIKRKVKKFIYVSTVEAIYKGNKGNEAYTEPTRFYPEKMDNPFATSKALTSYYITEKIKTYPNFNAAVVYPTMMVGPDDYKPSFIGEIINDCVDHFRQPSIKGAADIVDVRDVSEFIYKLSLNDIRDSFILSGALVSFENINLLVSSALENPKMKFLDKLSRMTTVPYKLIPKAFYEQFTEQTKYSSRKAREIMKYTARDVSDTIKDAVEFFIHNVDASEEEK